MRKKGKGGVPERKIKYGLSEADFRMVVKQYTVSKMCKKNFEEKKIEVLKAFFMGIIKGYEDLFEFLHITDEQFMTIFKELEPDTIRLEAKTATERIMEGSKKGTSKIITGLPGGMGAREVKAVKEIFDKQLKVGGKP
jgi:Asp-tRNA(Asn)/Glu-tRNA(Gln) amidotransferase B subunit